MIFLKILGLVIIIFTTTLIGFIKSNFLKSRAKKLNDICNSLENMAQFVHIGAGELNKLFRLSFKEDFLYFKNNLPLFEKSYLTKEDILLFEDFLKKIGTCDSKTEYKRILSYKLTFEKSMKEAENKAFELCKLYNTLGFLFGLAVCIILI